MRETVASPVRIGKTAIGALGLLALALGTLQSVVDPALPMLQRELGVGAAEGALVANALLITGAVGTPVVGKLGDRFGGRQVLLWVAAVVSVGGLLASLAPSLPVLLLGQVLQGAMVGALPLSFILVRNHLTPGESQAAIGVVLSLFTAGGIVGTLVAGPIAEGLSWQWIFALPTIVIVGATLIVARTMPPDPPGESELKLDWPGMALLSGTLLSLMLGLVAVTSGELPMLGVVGVVLFVAALATGWIVVESRAPAPMVDLRMLARPAMRNALLLTFLITVSFGMAAFLLPQMFGVSADGYGFGLSTTDIGLFLLPGAVAGALSDSVGGVAARRFGARTVVGAGVIVTAVTMVGLAVLHTDSWQLAVAKVLCSIAAGVGTTALLAGAATAVKPADTGIATSLLVVTRVIGFALGAQTGGAILAAGTDAFSGHPAESAFVTGFVSVSLIAASSLFVLRLTRKETHA